MRRTLPAVICCVLTVVGCTPKAVTPIGPGCVFQPDEKEQRLFEVSERDSRIFQSSGILHEDPAVAEYVNSVMGRILKPNREAYRPLNAKVYVIDSPVVNAFALPNGDVFVHAAILGRIRNEAQLAMLLGHEITHCMNRHAYQRYEDAYARTAAYSYAAVLSTAAGGNLHSAVSKVSELVIIAGINGYSRDKEREADRGGLTLMAQAGYDPAEGAKFFQNILDAADKKELRYNALYATHPKMKERLEDCTELAHEMPAALAQGAHDKGTDRYIQAAGCFIRQDIERQITRGKYTLAEAGARFLIENASADASGYAYLGEVHRTRASGDDLKQAKEAYSKAIQLDAGQATSLRGLGFLCMKEGQEEEAAQHLKAYAATAPTAPDLAYVQQMIQKLEKK